MFLCRVVYVSWHLLTCPLYANSKEKQSSTHFHISGHADSLEVWMSLCYSTVPPTGRGKYNLWRKRPANLLILCETKKRTVGSVFLLQKTQRVRVDLATLSHWKCLKEVSGRGGGGLQSVYVHILPFISSLPQWSGIWAAIDYHHYSWSAVRSWHTPGKYGHTEAQRKHIHTHTSFVHILYNLFPCPVPW